MQTIKKVQVETIPGTAFGIIFPVLRGTREELCDLMQFVPKTYTGKVIPVIEHENDGTVFVASVEGDTDESDFIASLLRNAFGDGEYEPYENQKPYPHLLRRESEPDAREIAESVERSFYKKCEDSQKEPEVHNVLSGKVFDLKRDAKAVADYCVGYNDVQVQKIDVPGRKKGGWVVVADRKVYQDNGYFA